MTGPIASLCRFVSTLIPVSLIVLLTIGCTNQAPAPTDAAQPATSTSANIGSQSESFEFEAPVQLQSPSGPVSVESPGYASPCWADINNDGRKDLLVGQFNGGKIRVFKNQGNMELAEGEWLLAGGEVAEVPGVW